MIKKIVILLAIPFIILVASGNGYSLGMDEEIKGLITAIEGDRITIKDFMGVEKTVELKNPEALTEFRVGDKAAVKDGILMTKEGSALSPPYQR